MTQKAVITFYPRGLRFKNFLLHKRIVNLFGLLFFYLIYLIILIVYVTSIRQVTPDIPHLFEQVVKLLSVFS